MLEREARQCIRDSSNGVQCMYALKRAYEAAPDAYGSECSTGPKRQSGERNGASRGRAHAAGVEHCERAQSVEQGASACSESVPRGSMPICSFACATAWASVRAAGSPSSRLTAWMHSASVGSAERGRAPLAGRAPPLPLVPDRHAATAS
eukprot:1205395-Pleurochrysis_carterae.AAC.1